MYGIIVFHCSDVISDGCVSGFATRRLSVSFLSRSGFEQVAYNKTARRLLIQRIIDDCVHKPQQMFPTVP